MCPIMQPNRDLGTEDILQSLSSSPNHGDVAIPDGAIDLFPNKIGLRILFLPNENRIMKAGPSVKMSEAEAMRYVALHTSIPVPEVQESYIKDGCGYIVMSKADGEPLGDVWEDLSSEQRALVVSQLRSYTEQLRSLTGEFYGALWCQPSEDIFFKHLPSRHEEIHYGPYRSRRQYNDGLVAALENSRPGQLSETDKDLARRIQAITDGTITFSHGDLHSLNIHVDYTGTVTAILDWEAAGFSFCGREYFEARSRSRNVEWRAVLDEIFPEKARASFDLFTELDQALTQYTGI